MKIVIVGAGRVGYAIAEQLLTEGHDITVVESDPERAAYISSTLDVIVVEGRANVDQLRIANVADADLLIAATTSDETNLISCMVGRKLGATHTIARVRDEEYYQDVALLQDELGLSLSINPERTSAKEISRTLRFPAATKVEPFANGLVELVEFKLREGSKLDGLRLNDFRGRYSDGILICAVEREGSVTIPNGDFVLAAGDYVTVVGAPHELHELFRKIGEFRHEAESVIIIGGGRIAERLALELARMHIHSTIIERDPARCRVMKTLLPEATIICADGTKPDVRREEGLPEADALVTLTESDETNLIISSFAYHEQVPKIVTKVDEDNFIELAESYGLTTIIQPADVTAGRIVEYVRWMQNSAHSSGVETLRMDADAIAMAGTHEALLQRFARERIPIMIGTQMITKGLNFENVTLVGVLNADQSLYVGDYRANERTFSLITQVVGRAGRRFDTGRAVIQTYSPLHPVILTAARQDYEAFYESEMQTREALRCPPVCDITMITAVGELEQQVLSSLLALKTRLQSLMEGQFADVKAPVLGPAAAQMVKVMGRYRYHLTIRAKDCARWRRLISGVLREFMQDGKNRGVTVFADSNNEM